MHVDVVCSLPVLCRTLCIEMTANARSDSPTFQWSVRYAVTTAAGRHLLASRACVLLVLRSCSRYAARCGLFGSEQLIEPYRRSGVAMLKLHVVASALLFLSKVMHVVHARCARSRMFPSRNRRFRQCCLVVAKHCLAASRGRPVAVFSKDLCSGVPGACSSLQRVQSRLDQCAAANDVFF